MQWIKTIDLLAQTGDMKLDFLVGNVDAYRDRLSTKKPPRVRNRQVKGFHARITPEALFIDKKTVKIPLAGKRSNGEEYATTVCIPHPFTYLLMKLFAFRDRQDKQDKEKSSHHAFDLFTIVGNLTENELDEAIHFGKNHTQEPHIQEAKQIVVNHFTGTSQSGIIAIKQHRLFQDTQTGDKDYIDTFLEAITKIFDVFR